MHQPLPSFYRESDKVSAELQRLASKCPGFALSKTKSDNGVKLDVMRVQLPGSSTAAPASRHRVAVVFGEHARELVTVESGIHFMRTLCGEVDPASGKDIDSSSLAQLSPSSNTLVDLKNFASELMIFPNANPISRRVVEKGDYCLRANEDGVDLNRNWASHWEAGDVSLHDDAPPGKAPFSEPETRILRDTLAEYKPSFFLSVHSGNLGVFAPYAYAKNAPTPTPKTISLLEDVARTYCKCPFGGAAQTIGYPCPGTSLDYVHDTLKAPNSFAVEIWIGGEEEQRGFRQRYEAQEARYQGKDDPMLSSLLERRSSNAERKRNRKTSQSLQSTPNWCLQNFNPTEKPQFDDVLTRWTQAYLTMIKKAPNSPTGV